MKSLLYLANVRLPTEKAYGIQIAHMCEAFAGQGLHVRLVTPTRRNAIAQDVHAYYGVKRNFEVRYLFAPDFYFPGRLDWVAVHIKNAVSALILTIYSLAVKADIIYSREEQLVYLLSFFKKNLIFEAHKYSSRRTFIYRRLLKTGAKVVAISDGIRERLIELGFIPDHVLVARDGVDVQMFSIDTTKEECREALGLPKEKTLVLYTGHLYEWKGARVLAEAAKHLGDTFIVVFVGGTLDDVRRYKDAYAESRNVLFLGWRPHAQIPMYLKAADVVVLPNSGKEEISRSYTSPLKMFEYMASGTPIIASDLPVIREVLSEANATLVIPNDPLLLSDAIRSTTEHASESQTRASRARQDVTQYSWDRRAARILAHL